ncbi:MAG: hypothetical protein II381_02695 [Victivallales bacterium]|nr:hypothetical protein [Victivallales bacterium]
MKMIGFLTVSLLVFIQAVAFGDVVLYDAAGKRDVPRELAATGGFDGKFSEHDGVLRIRFAKDGVERRMVAVKLKPVKKLLEQKGLDIEAKVKLAEGQTARPCAMFVEKDGGSWCRIGMPFPQDGFEKVRLNLFNLRQAAFSHDGNGKIDWADVEEIFIGMVVEGKGDGVLSIRRVAMTDQKFVPTKPLVIKVPKAKEVSRGADPAAKVSVEDAEFDGEHVLKETFKFPLGRHMYFTPSFHMPDLDYASYSGIRLTYKAIIPQPINGLLVTVAEGGGQFVAPAPKETSEWLSIDLKFKDFKMAGWAKKKGDNPQLDVAGITTMTIGCHGTANVGNGEGEILIRKLELIP